MEINNPPVGQAGYLDQHSALQNANKSIIDHVQAFTREGVDSLVKLTKRAYRLENISII